MKKRIKPLLAYFVCAIVMFGGMPGFCESALTQKPRGNTDRLVSYEPQMMDTPLTIRYPENWYAREEYLGQGRARVYFTREPIFKMEDQYMVGVGVLTYPGYFEGQSDDWNVEKQKLIEKYKLSGLTVINAEDIVLGGKNAYKITIESKGKKAYEVSRKLGAHLYTLEMMAPTAEFEKYKPVFQSMIDSLEWKWSKKSVRSNYDPATDMIANNTKSNAVYNGEKIEHVGAADLIRDKFLKTSKTKEE